MTALIERPTDGRSRLRRAAAPAATIAGLGLASLALTLRDPHVQGSWGVCPSYALFGVYCPGCGGLRAVNDLGHLDVAGAAHSNLVFVALVPLVVFFLGRWLLDAWQGRVRPPGLLASKAFYLSLGAVLVVFTLWRNLPGGTWLQP